MLTALLNVLGKINCLFVFKQIFFFFETFFGDGRLFTPSVWEQILKYGKDRLQVFLRNVFIFVMSNI